MNKRLSVWLHDNEFGALVREEPLGGGCINNVTRLQLDCGHSFILKYQSDPPDNLFVAEAAGLAALAASGPLRVPEVLLVDSDFILLQDLGQGEPGDDYWRELGSGLAQLHATRQPEFGFMLDNYCGSTLQDNTRHRNGFEFFANRRLRPLASAGFDRGLLDQDDMQGLDYIAEHLDKWIPEQPAVLIHGDLWSGNIHCDERGQPALIDPAAYWGWSEAELAMTGLFGRFDARFYKSYLQHSSLPADWEERAPLYNLYHLLNHLLLFGSSYLPPVRNIVNRFAR